MGHDGRDGAQAVGMSDMTEAERREAVRKWASTPAKNPDYEGATPEPVPLACGRCYSSLGVS